MSTTPPDPLNLDYRVKKLEDWQHLMETAGIATTLAVFDERQKVMSERMKAVEDIVRPLQRSSDETTGFWTKTKAWITVGLVTLITGSALVVQIVALATRGGS